MVNVIVMAVELIHVVVTEIIAQVKSIVMTTICNNLDCDGTTREIISVLVRVPVQ